MPEITSTEKQNNRDLRLQKTKGESDKLQNAEKSSLASGERGPYELAQEKSLTPDELKSTTVQPEKQADYKRQLGKERVLSQRETRGANNKENQLSSNKTGQLDYAEKLSSAGDARSVSGSWQRIKALRQKTKDKKARLKAKAGSDNVSKKQAEKMANQIVKKAWMVGHETVEELLIVNFYLLLIFGPIYLLLLVVRPLLAMLGFLTIKVKGVNIKMIPGYSLNEFFLRAKGAMIIALITALEWILILAAIYVFTHPFSAAWGLLKATWEAATTG